MQADSIGRACTIADIQIGPQQKQAGFCRAIAAVNMPLLIDNYVGTRPVSESCNDVRTNEPGISGLKIAASCEQHGKGFVRINLAGKQ